MLLMRAVSVLSGGTPAVLCVLSGGTPTVLGVLGGGTPAMLDGGLPRGMAATRAYYKSMSRRLLQLNEIVLVL